MLLMTTAAVVGAAVLPEPEPEGVDGVEGAAEQPATSSTEARAATVSAIRSMRIAGLHSGLSGLPHTRFLPQTHVGHIGVEERASEGMYPMSENLPMPQPGDTAPPIDAEMTGGGRFVLSDHAGQWVVVYFYPRANTPG
jgi:hypothetical protein